MVTEKYLKSCNTEFWKNVFRAELQYVLKQLKGAKDILSVGCGPAVIEAGLAEHGFNVTGLDISREALEQAPDNIRKIIGSAENMNFSDSSFDAAVYVVSLQFIEHYKQAVKQTARVLREEGKLLVLLLNPESYFFRKKFKNPASYISKIRHTNVQEIEDEIAKYFTVQTEYFLGIRNEEIFESRDPDVASLYVIKAQKKKMESI